MTHKPRRAAYLAPEGSTAQGYQLPAYGSSVTSPSLPVGEPGSSPTAMRLPGVEDRLAVPEAGEEYVDGVRYEVMGAEKEHADPQCRLAAVAQACVEEDYVASVELLTRSDEDSDFTTDVSIRRNGTDPRTDERYVEDISFEVANTQTLAELDKRARKLTKRGVRRVFGIMVQEDKVYEWTRSGKRRERSLRGQIRDRTLHTPLRIRAILDVAAAKRLVFDAMVNEEHPGLERYGKKREAEGREEGREEGLEKGLTEGLRRLVEDLCGALGIDWSPERETAVEAMGLAELEALRQQIVDRKAWPVKW